jgi:diguanylate cyclase (GGDEF)-like protein
MNPSFLRTLVGAIGLVVAIVITVAAPLGYFVVAYTSTADTLAFQADLNASRIAKFIYGHETLWQYQRVRLAEVIELPEVSGRPIRQQVFDAQNKLVLEEGSAPRSPLIRHSAPIVVRGEALGRIEIETTLLPVLRSAAIVAAFNLLLGFGAYFAVRMFPLRVLDQTLASLEAARGELQRQVTRFDAALTNMSQGLCMFDPDGRLVVSNSRFAEIYRLPPEQIVPGMTAQQIMALTSARYGLDYAERQGVCAEQEMLLRERRPGSLVEHLSDGRRISVSQRPMPDGGCVVTFDDITDRLAAEEKIEHLARFDPLTDLSNRTSLYERMEDLIGRLQPDETMAVLSLDLDRFKNVNERFGRPVGDDLLRAVADRVRNCVRSEDILARLGGDEFAVVLGSPGTLPDVAALAMRVIEALEAPYDLGGQQVIVGVSIGIAIAPGDGDRPDVLVKNADLALYRAKADGGGVYRFFEFNMDARMQARHAIELDLRKALANSELELFYQPVIDVESGRISGCEALVRWHHPERGLVPPLDFIPIAEETGLIVPLGEWVLKQACAEAARWPKDVSIAVNLSPMQFRSANLMQAVITAIAASGISPRQLELEITETVLLDQTEGAIDTLHQLRRLGIRIAMDDFGTGYSSLSYLRSFPFSKIKIDKSFVRDLESKEDSIAIIRAVVSLGSSLGITTTAEGVETEDQLARLAAEGCNEVQGFLFSRPRPAAEILPMLTDGSPRFERKAAKAR